MKRNLAAFAVLLVCLMLGAVCDSLHYGIFFFQ